MKRIVFFLLVTAGFLISCQQKNFIYIVRHAEKSTEPSGDVYLTQAGRNRAHTLKRMLEKKNITYIYSTKTNRTRETAQPLSEEIGIPIKNYTNDHLGKFVKDCIKLRKNILIVGHNNTVITILDSFHVQHSVKQIPESEYDNLFIVALKKGKVSGLKEKKYGKPSLPVAESATHGM